MSLFSGCGGLDLGIEQAGFSVIAANDNDPRAARAHAKNFPDAAFYLGSIAEFSKEKVVDLVGSDAIKDIDLVVGGPPCPPFSKSRFYLKDKPRAMADPVGEVTIGGYLETLRWARPKVFVLENVAGMAFKVHAETLNHILATAEQLGYRCDHRVLNAADFGVPQIRQRFFIVGVREDVSGEPFSWPAPTHSESGEIAGLLPWEAVGKWIGDLDTDENASDEGHVAGGKHRDLLTLIPPGENYLFLTAKRGYPDPQFEWRSRYWSFLLKLSPDMPSWTIQARRSNNMGPLHWKNRILRIEEVRRIQTFPDDWYLDGTIEQQWRQIGNAVPVGLARVMGQAVRDYLARASSALRSAA
ncbi:DNA cytosine methyltransferase [Curtobacterium sp. NPDC090217]|uniref:DNA cytosine methyltransferase n=1 Tax=Curtobacterium sp. NPDC090217 TaxID=3363970 RepID=UPI003811E158